MIVNEIFYSIQGEGVLAGVASVFIRLSGCPLRCHWCDTKYAWDFAAGQDMSLNQISEKLSQYPTSHVVITGGEPMSAKEIDKLSQKLFADGNHVTIETAGFKFVPDLNCNLMSISPKLKNSTPADSKIAANHEKERLNIPAIAQLMKAYNYQLKFVIDTEHDLQEIENIISDLGDVDIEKISLMPQACDLETYIDKAKIVAEICKKKGYRFSPRLQVLLYNAAKGF